MRRTAILATALLTLAAACSDGPPAPVALAAAAASPRMAAITGPATVCHVTAARSGPQYVSLRLGESGVLGHLDANGTPRAGHELDYLVSAQTPCPPPATPGTVSVCKAAGIGILPGTEFAFTINGETVVIPAGACADRSYRIGTRVVVREGPSAGAALASIALSPNAVGSSDVALSQASITIGVEASIVTFTNRSTVAGDVKVCHVAGMGVSAGYYRPIGIGSSTLNLETGATPDANCGNFIGVPAGSAEMRYEAEFGVYMTDVEVPGQTPVVDVANTRATFIVQPGEVTIVRVTSARGGMLKLCSVGTDALTVGMRSTFEMYFTDPLNPLEEAELTNGTGPEGNCLTRYTTSPRAGLVRKASGISDVVQIVASPGDYVESISLPTRSASVRIAPNRITTVTYTNAASMGAVEVCSVAGDPFVSRGDWLYTIVKPDFFAPTPTAQLTPAAAPGQCARFFIPEGDDVRVNQQQRTGIYTESIVTTPSAYQLATNATLSQATVRSVRGEITRVTFTPRTEVARNGWGSLVLCSTTSDASIAGAMIAFSWSDLINLGAPTGSTFSELGTSTSPRCTAPITLPAAEISTRLTTNFDAVVEAVTATPADPSLTLDLPNRRAKVVIRSGETTTLTYVVRVP